MFMLISRVFWKIEKNLREWLCALRVLNKLWVESENFVSYKKGWVTRNIVENVLKQFIYNILIKINFKPLDGPPPEIFTHIFR